MLMSLMLIRPGSDSNEYYDLRRTDINAIGDGGILGLLGQSGW